MKLSSIFILFLSLSFISSDARLAGKLLHPSANKNGERVITKGGVLRTAAAAVMNKPELHYTSKMNGPKQNREERNDQGLNFVTVKNHQRDYKNVGVYSDYSRPRTRPPAHN